jgi:hypothetical protein
MSIERVECVIGFRSQVHQLYTTIYHADCQRCAIFMQVNACHTGLRVELFY